MNLANTDRISSSPQSHVKCHCHQNDLHEPHVRSITFLKNCCTEFHENPTNGSVGDTRTHTKLAVGHGIHVNPKKKRYLMTLKHLTVCIDSYMRKPGECMLFIFTLQSLHDRGFPQKLPD